MRTITLEEHFATPAFLEGPGRKLKESAAIPGSPVAGILDKLCDIGEKRIAEMDAADISVQVLSLAVPGRGAARSVRRDHASQGNERYPCERRYETIRLAWRDLQPCLPPRPIKLPRNWNAPFATTVSKER